MVKPGFSQCRRPKGLNYNHCYKGRRCNGNVYNGKKFCRNPDTIAANTCPAVVHPDTDRVVVTL